MNQDVNKVFKDEEHAEKFIAGEQFLASISGERFYPEAYMNPEIVEEHWKDDPVTLWWFGKEGENNG